MFRQGRATHRRRCQEAPPPIAMATQGPALVLPELQLSGTLTTDPNPVAAMLDLTTATVTGSGYSSVPDLLASNAAVQAVDARRPVNGTSNSQAIATYTTASATCLVLPNAANNNNDLTTIVGFACWLRFATYGGIFKYLIDVGGANGTYDNCKFEIATDSSRRINVYHFGADTNNYNGRLALSANASCPVAGTWFFLRWAFSGGQATEALRCRTFVDEVEKTNTFSNVGAGGDPRALRVSASNVPIVIGNYQDGTDATYAMSAAMGPLLYFFKRDLSAAQGLALMNHRRPTP